MRDAGAAVVGIDLPAYLAALDAAGKDCVYLVADFERLGHAVERATGATTFHAPLVAGTGEGGALALDILAQTPADTLGGAFAADPAAAVPLGTALCTDAARSRGADGSAYALPAGAPPAPLTVVLSADAPAASAARTASLLASGVVLNVRQRDHAGRRRPRRRAGGDDRRHRGRRRRAGDRRASRHADPRQHGDHGVRRRRLARPRQAGGRDAAGQGRADDRPRFAALFLVVADARSRPRTRSRT